MMPSKWSIPMRWTAEKSPRLVAEVEECFVEGELLARVVRERLATVNSEAIDAS